MNITKKIIEKGSILAITGAIVLAGIPIAIGSGVTAKAARDNDYSSSRILGRYDVRDHSRYERDRHRNHRGRIRVLANTDFYNRHRMGDYYPMFRRYQPGNFLPRRLVLVNRDSGDSIIIRNRNTGPFSVNRTVVRVDRDFFSRVSNDIDIDQDVDINVNTGNNTISYNTVVGNVSTGDVDISVW